MKRASRTGARRAHGAPATDAVPRLVAAAAAAWSIAIRVGESHRFIRIWAVVDDGRIYARSWSLSPGGWYRTLATEKAGTLKVGRYGSPFRAVRVRGEALRRAVDRAYLKKYARPGEAKYAVDLCRPASRGSTVELRLT